MDIKNRKTTLGDDAEIYNRSKDTITKEELKNLPLKQKLLYFKDYYLKGTLAVVAAVVFALYMVYITMINPTKEVLSVMFLSGSYVSDQAGMSQSLKEYLGIERKKDTVSVSYYDLNDSQMNMAYMTIVGAGQADLIICPYSVFERQARLGFLADLSEYLPPEMYERLSGRMVTGRVVETDVTGETQTIGDELPYGIDISGSAVCEEYVLSSEQTILCVFAAPPNSERVLQAIPYFTD